MSKDERYEDWEDAVKSRFESLAAANVADAMDRLGAVDAGIQAVWNGARIVGPAFTVWSPAGDNHGIHEALTAAAPGSVIVVNGGGYVDRALLGELIGERAINAGVAGFAIDGAVRDVKDLEEIGLPVFARGSSPAGPYRNGPAKLEVPIAFGGVAIAPGDFVVGDPDGMVVIPRADVDEVLIGAEAKQRDESEVRSSLLAKRKGA